MSRVLKRIGLFAGLGVLVLAGFAAWQIGPRNIWGMLRYDQRHEGKLVAGDPAPDLLLTELDGRTQTHLREHTGQEPTVLIFGSFT